MPSTLNSASKADCYPGPELRDTPGSGARALPAGPCTNDVGGGFRCRVLRLRTQSLVIVIVAAVVSVMVVVKL